MEAAYITLVLTYAREGKTYRLNDVVNQLLGFVDLFFGVCHDQTVQVFLLIAGMGGIGAAFSLFYGSFSTDGDFGAGFGLHLLEGVTTGSNE